MNAGDASGDPLADAQATIARQAAEIEDLRRRLGDDRFAHDLREALALAATTGTIAAPVSHARLLEMIVATAADIIGANAASLFLIDEVQQDLIFEVALGEKAEEVKKFRVPLGKGIAGLVALSGQPMAISDTAKDNRDAADIAQAVGYAPKNILCVPLFYEDQVIGVLELLDKKGAPSFSMGDMEALGLFANQAAVAIEQSRTQRDLAAMIGTVVESLGGVPDYQKQSLKAGAGAFAANVEADSAYTQALDLARLVQEIAHHGPDELRACRTLLAGFADYLRARPHQIDNLGLGDRGAFR